MLAYCHMRVSELIKSSLLLTDSLRTVAWRQHTATVGICLGGAIVFKIWCDCFLSLPRAANDSLVPSKEPTFIGSLSLLKGPSIDFHEFFWSDKKLQYPAIQPVLNLSVDAWRTIAGFLDLPSIFKLIQTCKGLLGLRADTQVLRIQYENHRTELEAPIFGKKKWNIYFGDVGEVDPLPKALVKSLQEPCPFWPGKRVKETHIACWIPEKVNGIDLNLHFLGELVKNPLRGLASKYSDICSEVMIDQGTASFKKGYWVLLTKTVIEETQYKSYEKKKDLFKNYPEYEMPKLLPAAIAIFTHHVWTGEYLYGCGSVGNMTSCQEKSEGRPLCIGNFAAGGLFVGLGPEYDLVGDLGVGGLREFVNDPSKISSFMS